MVFTLTEPMDSAVPPMELMNAFSLDVSDSSRQQLERVLTSPLMKKLLSFQTVLWSEHQRANSSSTNLPSR